MLGRTRGGISTGPRVGATSFRTAPNRAQAVAAMEAKSAGAQLLLVEDELLRYCARVPFVTLPVQATD